jgi:hypothetical protein
MVDLILDQTQRAEPLLKVTRNGAERHAISWCHRTDRMAVRPIAMPAKGHSALGERQAVGDTGRK